MRLNLPGQSPAVERIGTGTAEGPNHKRRAQITIFARRAATIIPIRKKRPSAGKIIAQPRTQRTPARDPTSRPGFPETLNRVPRPQLDRGGDALLSTLVGRIAARDCDRQTTEFHIHIALMDRFNALGSAGIAGEA